MNDDDGINSTSTENTLNFTTWTTTSTATTNVSDTSEHFWESQSTKTKPPTVEKVIKDKTKTLESWEESRFKDWDDSRLKNLLEEAYSYKNPRDKENKSEIFLQLLQKAESEKEEQPFAFRAIKSRYTKHAPSNSQKQGGSLQDLVDVVRNETILDCDSSFSGQRTRRHNHNSRQKIYSPVSFRQREGGSLPSNVNGSNCSSFSSKDQPFMTEVRKHQRNNTDEVMTCSIISDGLPCKFNNTLVTGETEKNGGNNLNVECHGGRSICTQNGDIIIDMGQPVFDQLEEQRNTGRHDKLQSIQFDRLNEFDMKIPRANIIKSMPAKTEFAYTRSHCYVDEPVHFTTLDRGKPPVDCNYLPLDENYKSCKSILGEKSELAKTQSSILSATKTVKKKLDENGNSLSATYNSGQSQMKNKKKKSQSERNTKTIDLESVAGYRGLDPIEVLVKYIESSEDIKQNDKVCKMAESKKKDKKKEKQDRDKDVKNKMKKCNSLEELRSCSKLDADERERADSSVTMRTRSNKNNLEVIKNFDIEDKLSSPSNRGERRSWGIEELTYLGENKIIEEVCEKRKEKEKRKSKEKEVERSNISEEKKEKNVIDMGNLSKICLIPIDSLVLETPEFHVVTKKKKPKKREPFIDIAISRSTNTTIQKNRADLNYPYRKYASSNFSNDRDAYLNTFNYVDESRRKSTSSVPPSEKSDSSDLDSVHSLPINSTTRKKSTSLSNKQKLIPISIPMINQLKEQNQPQSYADIARTSKAEKPARSQVADKWAAVNADKIGGICNSHHAVQAETGKFKTTKKKKIEFPELSSNTVFISPSSCGYSNSTLNNVGPITLISYSQSLTAVTDEKLQTAEPLIGNRMANEKKSSQEADTFQNRNISNPRCSATTLGMQLADNTKKQQQQSFENDKFYNMGKDQYPALEKTFKHHNFLLTSVLKQDPFVDTSSTLMTILPSTKIINTNNLKTNANVIFVDEECSAVSSVNISTNSLKKSKCNYYNPNDNKATESEMCSESTQGTLNSNTAGQTQHQTSLVLAKKSKKDKQVLVTNWLPTASSGTTQTTGSAALATNPNINTSSRNRHITKSNTNNNPRSYIKNSYTGSDIFNKCSNRPAVIILNDNKDGRISTTISNEFTFGDFNEDEIRLFSNENQQTFSISSPELQQKHLQTPMSADFAELQQKHHFEDVHDRFNKTCSSLDASNNSTQTDVMLIDSLSPNISFSNQSCDSGIVTNLSLHKIQHHEHISDLSNKSISSSSQVNNSNYTILPKTDLKTYDKSPEVHLTKLSVKSNAINATVENVTALIKQSDSYLLSSFVNTSDTGPVSSTSLSVSLFQSQPQSELSLALIPQTNVESFRNLKKKSGESDITQTKTEIVNVNYKTKNNNKHILNTSLPPQQLETCNDIESAIIAAAKAAVDITNETKDIAKNSIIPAASFSIGSISIDDDQQIILNTSKFNDTSADITTDECLLVAKVGETSNLSIDARNLREVIDISFIPPLATSMQNNAIIIDFIGSAWEEVSNSKVTQFYDEH